MFSSQDIFKKDFTGEGASPRDKNYMSLPRAKKYTLMKFAQENFRKSYNVSVPHSDNRRISNARQSAPEVLWKHTREPMKAPLLAKLCDKKNLVQDAVGIFINILKYMGDLPSHRQRIGTEYTNQIFRSPLENVSRTFYHDNFES